MTAAGRIGGEGISLYLLPKVRDLGAALPIAAAKILAATGLRQVFLWVLEDNQPAHRFYEKQGFIPSGERPSAALRDRKSVV